jgi:hypothetical protein
MVTVNMQNYVVRVKSAWANKYADAIGFSIPRKSKSLEFLVGRAPANV